MLSSKETSSNNTIRIALHACFVLLVRSSNTNKNVIVILADDAGFLTSAYNNTVCQTPSLDALAAKSIVFDKGYTSVSSCSPSRSVLLTGLPQHQNGMYGLEHSVHHFQSFSDVKSLPNILRSHKIRSGLIGKKHVAPDSVYKFDYDESSEHHNIDQIGRNITYMKHYINQFLNSNDSRPFFLFLAFFDTHRAGPFSKFGPFKNEWGTGEPGKGSIPDWKPQKYDPNKIPLPPFLPDTPESRKDLAAMYTSFNRMDQSIGIVMDILKKSGHENNTLILFTADNGIPFPNAKTDLYEPGMGEPMMMSVPTEKGSWGTKSDAVVSTMDFVPTILDWFNITYPVYRLNEKKVKLTGKSLLPLTRNAAVNYNETFSSHNFHEVTMPYPMRVVRNEQFRLIHNLNNRAPYPMATDIYSSPTFMDIIDRVRRGEPTHWFKSLDQYYYRDEWELFDVIADPLERNNLANNTKYTSVLKHMKNSLKKWLHETNDPWRCMPHGVLINNECFPLLNSRQ